MSDEYIEEGNSGSVNRSFLLAAAALTGLLVLVSACSIYFLLNGRQSVQVAAVTATVSAIETQNAVIMVTNAAVTQTIAAMETEAAQPTTTPVPTNTTAPTSTPVPTNTATPVVAEGEAGEEETAVDSGTPAATVEGGDEGEEAGAGTAVATTSADSSSGTGGTTNASDNRNNSASGTLPQTGIDSWQAIVMAAVFVGLFIVARRLRRA